MIQRSDDPRLPEVPTPTTAELPQLRGDIAMQKKNKESPCNSCSCTSEVVRYSMMSKITPGRRWEDRKPSDNTWVCSCHLPVGKRNGPVFTRKGRSSTMAEEGRSRLLIGKQEQTMSPTGVHPSDHPVHGHPVPL